MSQNPKVKIKQFEWFEMQTKVRQIIQEILGPIQKRILESSALLNRVKSNQAEDQIKIQQIALMIANDPKVFQTGVFATVDKKFVQHSKLIQQLGRQIQQENKYVQNKFKILDLRMQQSSEVLKNIASLKQRVSRQMEIQNDNIYSLRENITKMIDDLNMDIRQTRKQIVENAENSEKRDSSINEEIIRVKQNILTIQDNINLHRDMHMKKTVQLEEHERTIQTHTQQIKDLFENKYLTKRLGDFVEDMDGQIRKILFKVDSISPLVTQAQISQCLTAILPPKIKSKICIYEHKKYFQLNKQVLQKDFRRVQNKFNGLGLLEQMQKKCTKQIVQLKRKKLLEMGIDIDHATYEQRQKYYSEVSLDDELNMDYEENKVAQKIDEEEVKKIMGKFMSVYMSEFNQQIKIEIQDNKKYIYSVEDEIRHQVGRFQKTIGSVKSQCAAFHTEHVLQLKLTDNSLKNSEKAIKSLQNSIIETQDLQRLFYNFCSLINHLSIQDEIDKQNITLLGSKQSNADDMNKNKERNSVVALDGKCFSCNGYPATTLTAFKMACLAYHPSSIKIDSKQYKREELLQFTTGMLQNIKKSIQDNSPSPDTIAVSEDRKEMERVYSRQLQPDSKVKSQTLNLYNPFEQKKSFKNNFVSKHLETEDCANEDRARSNSKYRKKTLNTTYSSSYTKNKTSLKRAVLCDDMMQTSIIFNSLKKKNSSFLN